MLVLHFQQNTDHTLIEVYLKGLQLNWEIRYILISTLLLTLKIYTYIDTGMYLKYIYKYFHMLNSKSLLKTIVLL